MMNKNIKVILHIDLNAFYASCEEAENPSLKNKNIAVGGTNNDKGIITTANYNARSFGVHSAMPVWKARKLCPNLIVIPCNFKLYSDYSEEFFRILLKYSDLLEPMSIDEGFLDVTKYLQSNTSIPELVKKIQEDIYETLNIGCSIGVAPNKFLAKMASDMKKPFGITILRKRDIESIIWPMKISSMYGIGKTSSTILKTLGYETIGDLANCKNPKRVEEFIGNKVYSYIEFAKGNGSTIVDPTSIEGIKSIGNSMTYTIPLTTYDDAYSEMIKLLDKALSRSNKRDLVFKTLSFQLKYEDSSFNINKSHSLDPAYFTSRSKILNELTNIFEFSYIDNPIKLISVSFSNFIKESDYKEQLDIFSYNPGKKGKEESLISVVNELQMRFGEDMITKGVKTDKINTRKYDKK